MKFIMISPMIKIMKLQNYDENIQFSMMSNT